MKQESKVLISVLRCAVAGTEVELPTRMNWKAFLSLASAHNVEALAYDGLNKVPEIWTAVPGEVRKCLFSAYMRAVYLDAQYDHIQQDIQKRMTQEQILHIFLKGAVLKYNYPVPALRTMSDLDVLVYASDFGRINRIMDALRAEHIHSDGNHRTYRLMMGLVVEFHPNLLHHETPVGTQINPGWQYAKPNMSELTEEGIYLNTICHLANHFVTGGVGVRFVLDVWVNRHLRKPGFDRDFVEQELEKFGLLRFAKQIEDLSDWWFGDGEETPLLAELGEYILTSGSHGISDRAMLNAVSLSPGGSRSSALLKKAFYSRAEMEDRFTWLKGRPWLMPVAWCVRAFRAVTRHGDLIVEWGKGTGQFSKAEIVEQREKLARFGIEIKT